MAIERSFNIGVDNFVAMCYRQHDEVCNQKYDALPYSFHLKSVVRFAKKFMYLLTTSDDHPFVLCIASGHDLIEDARMTYNDILLCSNKEIADAIYACTEMRGRDRSERKNDEFYKYLVQNKLAVFVKLCDIMANSTFSIATNSSMFVKQKEEWLRIKYYHLEYFNHETLYADMFEFLDKIYAL